MSLDWSILTDSDGPSSAGRALFDDDDGRDGGGMKPVEEHQREDYGIGRNANGGGSQVRWDEELGFWSDITNEEDRDPFGLGRDGLCLAPQPLPMPIIESLEEDSERARVISEKIPEFEKPAIDPNIELMMSRMNTLFSRILSDLQLDVVKKIYPDIYGEPAPTSGEDDQRLRFLLLCSSLWSPEYPSSLQHNHTAMMEELEGATATAGEGKPEGCDIQ